MDRGLTSGKRENKVTTQDYQCKATVTSPSNANSYSERFVRICLTQDYNSYCGEYNRGVVLVLLKLNLSLKIQASWY